MSCLQAEWLDAYFDGELDAVRAAEYEAHLGDCSTCREALAGRQALREAIAGAALYASATPSFHRRVRSGLPRSGAPGPSRRLVWTAAAAVTVLLLVGLWTLGPGRRDAPERLVAAAILDAHVRSLLPGHLTDVASSDQHTVKPWFDGRLDFSPRVVDLASDGFPLTGGRLDVVTGRSVAALVYGRRQHVVNLFVWPSEEPAVAEPRSGSARGYQWIRWHREGMSYWAVSDTSTGDLEEFARLLQSRR